MATHFSILCLENPHGQRNVEGYKESDKTERLSTAQRGSIDNKNLRILRYRHSTSHHRQSQHMLIKWSFLA